MTATSEPGLVDRLRTALSGAVLDPDHADYEGARTVVYGGFDRHPIVVVRPESAADVAAAVRIAAETGTELAVRSGGHSLAGHGVSDGGMVIDMKAMKRLEVDPESRTAWAETGLTTGEYAEAVGEHGLATGFGDAGTVGIGGITLGGGVGLLSRKYGLTIDSVLAAEVVTAEGEILTADEHNHPDLFWALRGGGGNFGVVTRFKYRLHPVDQVYGGILMVPATPEVLAGFIEASEAASEDLTTIINVLSSVPMPLPVPVEGPVIMAMMAYTGDLDSGEAAVAPFRGLAEPIMDMVGPTAYPAIFQGPEEEFHPVVVGRTNFADTIEPEQLGNAFDRLQETTAMFSVIQIRVLGGAIARVPAEATAYAHRDRPYMTTVTAIFEDESEIEEHTRWVEPLARSLANGRTGAYVGFVGDEGDDRVQAAYPRTTLDRLAQVKAKYDPHNLFRMNVNVKPA